MHKIFHRHKLAWTEKDFLYSFLFGLALFVVSLFINYYAGTYATAHASNSVKDILLDNIPTLDVDGIFVYGFYFFIIFVMTLLFYIPKSIPFVTKASALFVFVRSFFIVLTHIGPSPMQVMVDLTGSLFGMFNFVGDLFFSGHTGLPFLLSLVFWENIYLRILFISISIFFGATVLLGHLHYSIDVFGAYFITYTIFHIAQWIFPKDYKRLVEVAV